MAFLMKKIRRRNYVQDDQVFFPLFLFSKDYPEEQDYSRSYLGNRQYSKERIPETY